MALAQSHLSVMFHKAVTPGLCPSSPTSVNYISSSTAVVPRSLMRMSASLVPTEKSGHIKRSRFNVKAHKALKGVKKGLRTVSRVCKPGSKATALASINRPGSRMSMNSLAAFHGYESTPTVCVTKASFKGNNVRLAIHQGPATPAASQLSLMETSPTASNGSTRTSRPSPRFQHPVVTGVIADQSHLSVGWTSNHHSSSETLAVDGLYTAYSRPSTAATVATLDFENQVNPKRMFRQSAAVSSTESFNGFKDVMDGVKAKSPPRAAAAAVPATLQFPVSATAPSLPFISRMPTMSLRNSEGTSFATFETAQPDLPTSLAVPVAPVVRHPSTLTPGPRISHPSALKPGSALPTSTPRAPRPHTTGGLLPGAEVLPYIAYNPNFNPYDSAIASSSSSSSTAAPSFPPSRDGLAAAIAEAEAAAQAAVQAAVNQRHSALYEAGELGFLSAPAPLPSSSFIPSLPSSPAPSPAPAPVRRKAVASAALAPLASHPVAPAPAPAPLASHPVASAPHRPAVPQHFSMNDNGFPLMGKAAAKKAEKKARVGRVGTVKAALGKLGF